MEYKFKILTFCIFESFILVGTSTTENSDYTISAIETRLENKVNELVLYLARCLQRFNDEHISGSEVGKFLRYDEIKPKIEDENEGRNLKKTQLAMMPMIFHMGATSTWMIMTTILTAKSVAIGLVLLVFKIAISSAKISSFFTAMKHHQWKDYSHHESGSWSPPVHYEHI